MAYERRFDHEEAARRHAAGESYGAIARSYGVTLNAVSRAVRRLTDPDYREHDNAISRAHQRRARQQPCARGCGRMAWTTNGREGVCPRCRAAERATTVREDELLCSTCGEWKPDEQFPRLRKNFSRRGRHGTCRGCQAEVKRAYRARLTDEQREAVRARDRERARHAGASA